MPIVSIGVAVALIFSIIATATTGIANGTVSPGVSAAFGGFIIFIIAIAAVGIAGFIMFMYSMHSLSNYYKEPAIFKNVLYAFILSIISTVVIFALEFAVIIAAITGISQTNTPSTTAVPIILSYVVVIVVALVFGIVNGVLYMRAFNKLKEKSGVDNFGTAGILYLIGIIIPLIAWIAWIFAAMGFNKLKANTTPPPYVPYSIQPPPSNTTQTKRCPNCGAENRADALYCSNCGKPLQ
ncbi:MAG TPA: DUF996 domain-containing protein [Candidatus Bathyarchaeia archaeon]